MRGNGASERRKKPEKEMVLTCIEDLINTNRKTIEQFRARFFAPPEDAIFRVGPIGQGEHRHR